VIRQCPGLHSSCTAASRRSYKGLVAGLPHQERYDNILPKSPSIHINAWERVLHDLPIPPQSVQTPVYQSGRRDMPCLTHWHIWLCHMEVGRTLILSPSTYIYTYCTRAMTPCPIQEPPCPEYNNAHINPITHPAAVTSYSQCKECPSLHL
jgi:hypothetical protein